MDVAKQLIAFCHFKGGVGTSFLASNVALELAKNKVLTCLIDFDTKLPNCANILGMEIKKKSSLYRFFSNNNPDIIGDFFINDKNVSPHLYITSSSSEDEVEILEDINDNSTDVDDLLTVTKETFDIVIADLPVDYQNPQVIETIIKADKVLIIGDLDINTIENSFRFLQMYKSINVPLSKFIYIPNKFFSNDDITINTISETLGIRLGPEVPLDYQAVYDSIIKSSPIVNTKHKIANAIHEICGLITGNIAFTGNASNDDSEPKFKFGAVKEEVAPTKFNFVFDEEGGKSNGNSES